MRKVRFIANTIAAGHPVRIGEELEIEDRAAEVLVGYRKAVYVEDVPPPSTGEVETATDKKAAGAVDEAKGRTGRWGKGHK